MAKFLIIQTAFIGDVVLATPVIESIASAFPDAAIDFLLRKGNENLLEGHPLINELLVWNKKDNKYRSLLKLIGEIRKVKYDYIINLQRFASTGILTALSNGKTKIGFKKNPFSFAFSIKVKHLFEKNIHEVDRNLVLIESLTNKKIRFPKLYPSRENFEKVKAVGNQKYVCLAPSSVWFTKQLPKKQWVDLCKLLSNKYHLCFLGASGDAKLCEEIIKESEVDKFTNYCGKLTFLESAALMRNAEMNYVNDSAPLHFASAINAKATAFFCSTIPQFGFGPLSDVSQIAEINFDLKCRPCGLHGKRECPEAHFDCGYKIDVSKYLPAE